MNDKYEITEETHPDYPQLRRIRALRDVRPGVRKGDTGGWVESESNLATYAPRLVAFAALCDAQAALWEPRKVVKA